MPQPILETDRLILRHWRAADRAAFAALNADPEVMAHFERRLSRHESDGLMSRMQDRLDRDGIGFCAIERKAGGELVGMAGLARADFDAAVCPCVEVGWRLSRAHWGQGYATEAGAAWLAHGFDRLGFAEIVAFVVPANRRSQAVMTRLGMARDPARDFEHPALPAGNPLRAHWLYARRSAMGEAP